MGQIFRLRDILYGVRKHLSVVIATTVCGLIIGLMIFVVQYFSSSNMEGYQIYASFSISTVNASGIYTNGTDSPGISDFELADEMMPAVMYVCQSETVCGEIIDRLGLVGVSIQTLQQSISMSQTDETSVMSVTLTWEDEEEGMDIMSTFLEVLPSALQEVFAIGDVRIIEQPISTLISSPVRISIVLKLTALGLLVGLLFCFTKLYLHPTLIETKDIGELFELNLLSEISETPDYSGYLDENLITNREDLPSDFRESYTALAHILLHQMEEDHFCLFVTSAAKGEGKTTVVANLGLELAALDKKVLLIDFDLSSPTLGSCFLDHIDYMNTVNAAYFDECSVQNAIVTINENLDLLPACLDRRKMGIDRFAKKLVAQMEEDYDIILLDTEPVGESSEMLYFSNVSNLALFVIRYDYTPCDEIESSIDKLRKTNTQIQGAVVNRVLHLGIGRSGAEDYDSQDKKNRKLFDRLKKKNKEKPSAYAGSKDVSLMNDDSDLVDDVVLKELLQKMESGHTVRRNQAMPRDDEDDLDNRIADLGIGSSAEDASAEKVPDQGIVQNQMSRNGSKPHSEEVHLDAEGTEPITEENHESANDQEQGAEEVRRIGSRNLQEESTFPVPDNSTAQVDQFLNDLDGMDQTIDSEETTQPVSGHTKLTYNDWDGDDF